MAKLGKVKFGYSGYAWKGRTTSMGDIELYLHYDSSSDIFYFNPIEVNAYLEKEREIGFYHHVFAGCRTRQSAIDVLSTLLATEGKTTKMLKIQIGIPERLWKVKNPEPKIEEKDLRKWKPYNELIDDGKMPDYLLAMMNSYTVSERSGISISFDRVMKVEHAGVPMYASCNERWNYSPSRLSKDGKNLIEWTPERELFLIGMQEQLDELCIKVLDFFKADTLEKFLLRMEEQTKNKLLTQ